MKFCQHLNYVSEDSPKFIATFNSVYWINPFFFHHPNCCRFLFCVLSHAAFCFSNMSAHWTKNGTVSREKQCGRRRGTEEVVINFEIIN